MSYKEHKTIEYVWQQVDIFTTRQERLLSTIKRRLSCHGSAMYVVMIRCRTSYYKEQWMVIIVEEDLVNYGRTTSSNGGMDRPVDVVIAAQCT